jgi:hypothetical protein
MFGASRTMPLFLLLASCTTVVDDASLEQRAIDRCVDEYTRLSGRALDPEVGRAYAVAGDGKVELLFTRGELGTFGERSASYRAYLSCGVLSDSMKIYFLVEPLRDPWVDVPGSQQITEAPRPDLRESLYLRTDAGFELAGEQPRDPDKVVVAPSIWVD